MHSIMAYANLPVQTSLSMHQNTLPEHSFASGIFFANSPKKLMHFLFLLAMMLSFKTNSAQTPVTVNSTGGVVYTALYSNLKQAFDSINNGYQTGSIEILITGNTTEGTATCKLDSSGKIGTSGVSSYSNITLKPAGGVFTISGATTAGNPLIDLNGADHFTIDGSNGIGDSLIISNTTASATSNTSTIRLINDAANNIIRNVCILGAPIMSTTTNGGLLFISTAASGGMGNDNNLISKCFFANNNATNTNFPYKMIYINGTTTSADVANSSIVIDSNKFVNYRANGVFCNTGSRQITVSNNHFYHTATLASSAIVYAPIWISNASAAIGEGFLIQGNFIGGSAPFCLGTKPLVTLSTVFQVIYLNCATTAPSYINGNQISNLSITTTSTTVSHSYIFLNGGRIDCGTQKGNLIGSMSDTSSLIMTYSNASASNFNAFGCAGANTTPVFDTIKIENNRFGGFTIRTTSTSGISMRFFDPTGSTGLFYFRYNAIGSSTVPGSIRAYMPSNNDFGFLCRSSSVAGIHQFVGNYFSNISNISTAGGTLNGVSLNNATNWRVDSNTFENFFNYSNIATVADAAQVFGINFKPTGSLGSTCIGNTVRNFIALHPTVKTSLTGLSVGGLTTNSTTLIAGNKISKLYSLTSDTSTIIGIYAAGDPAGQTISVQNNEVSLGTDSAGNAFVNACAFYGIQRLRGNTNFYHNSVLITGNGAGNSVNTFAFFTSDTGGVRVVKNNVFSNQRSFSSLSAKNNISALIQGAISSGAIANLTQNYNLYHAPNSGGLLISNNGTAYSSLGAWQSAAAAIDYGSASGDPLFVSASRLQGMNGSAITYGDNTLGVNNDILNTTRTSYYMGAYEVNNVLPVSLTSFIGNRANGQVKLNWFTASEENNFGFFVERSADGNHFESVGFVRGSGNSSKINSYTYSEILPTSFEGSVAFYRLKQVDINQETAYSKTISLQTSAEEKLTFVVYPNPFVSAFSIQLKSALSEKINYQIFSLEGKQLSFGCDELAPINSAFSVKQLDFLPIGVYVLKLQFNNETHFVKIIKE